MLSKFFDESPCHEALDGFLDESNLFFFFSLFIVVKDFIALLFFGEFFELLFLEVDGFKGSDDTLSPSFDFLDDSDGGFHVGIEGGSFFDDFFFREGGFLEIEEELFDNLVAFFLIGIFVIPEIPGDGHLDFGGSYSHFE